MKLTRTELDEARAVVYQTMAPTPQYAWPLLGNEIGAEVWVKHEDNTPTGAFKVRGGLVFMHRLKRDRPHVTGVVSATTGNHGQSLAFAGRAVGVPVVIVVPRGNSIEKNAAMVGFGAELIEFGSDFEAAREYGKSIAAERGYELVPPFHADLVTGVASYPAELFDAAGQLDAVYVPIGMGTGINATIAVRDLYGLKTEIIGVVASNAPAYALSFETGKLTTTESARTFADGVATRSPDPVALEAILRGVKRVVTVSENAIAEAMRLCYRTTHHLPCGAGAISLAALHAERDLWRAKRVAVILTSSNIDTTKAATILAGKTVTA